jgi:hypothetical protein
VCGYPWRNTDDLRAAVTGGGRCTERRTEDINKGAARRSYVAPNSYACGHLESGQPYLWGTRANGFCTRSCGGSGVQLCL